MLKKMMTKRTMASCDSLCMFNIDPNTRCEKWQHPGGDPNQWRPHGFQLPSQNVLTAGGEHAVQQMLQGTLADEPDRLTDEGCVDLDWLGPLWNGPLCKTQRDTRACRRRCDI